MTAVLDQVWTAVGDPSRRRLLDLLLDTGESTPTKLASQLPLTRQAVSKHLAVLERAGLVNSTPQGRQMTYRIRVDEFDRATRSIAEVAARWDRRLGAIKAIAEAIENAGR
ncbi:ArsR/SmtB family transcription factor [Candidatus Solirubrobacter pratensis]|uniref:ArsR/SmtB family transcription factor n=1 Tax=Candidatus Solirubrobacter pratensis TaxID=1298857 RepID=UPI00042A3384|nr:metalloregulator ArsR/SmtB family transcription factor [Candidatus Solirubrobacter pratensis]